MSKFELGRQDATVDQLDVLAAHYGKSLSELFADLEPEAPDQPLQEWIDFYWRLSEVGRKAQLQAWREAVQKTARPSGAARRSVKREHGQAAEATRQRAASGKPSGRDTRR